MHLTELRTRADLVAVTGESDVFARHDQAEQLEGWALGDSVAVLRTATWRPPTLFVWGPDVGPILDRLGDRIVELGGVSVPYDQRGEIESRFTVTEGGDWVWMCSRTFTGPIPGSDRIVEFDDTRDAVALSAFAAENPTAEGKPGTGVTDLWLGILEEDRIVACGARQRLPSGISHLAGILVTAAARGRGYGRAVSGALTDRAVEEHGICTLGMYHRNTRAAGVYASLGYTVDKTWASRRISGHASSH